MHRGDRRQWLPAGLQAHGRCRPRLHRGGDQEGQLGVKGLAGAAVVADDDHADGLRLERAVPRLTEAHLPKLRWLREF